MQERLRYRSTAKNKFVSGQSEDFDVTIYDTPERRTQAYVNSNPSGENPHYPIFKTPSGMLRKADVRDSETLHRVPDPREYADYEYYCVHHGAHGH